MNRQLLVVCWLVGVVQARSGLKRQDDGDRTCEEGYFKCNDGRCIYREHYCKGWSSGCTDGTELPGSCQDVECQAGESRCVADGRCTSSDRLCNGIKDCSDSSDETPEHCALPLECPSWYPLKCPGIRQCLYSDAALCNGQKDCNDNSDEDPAFCSTRTCQPDEIRCHSGQCISKEQFCGRSYTSCNDGSVVPSRSICPAPTTCPAGKIPCATKTLCIYKTAFCDNANDCLDNSDEDPEFCESRTCGPDQIRCLSGQCIDTYEYCFGSWSRCSDGGRPSRDRHCPKCNPRTNQFQCGTSSQCIHENYVCNGNSDCANGADEPAACVECAAALLTLRQTCGELPLDADMSASTVADTDLRDVCSPVQGWFSCVSGAFSDDSGPCASIQAGMVNDLRRIIAIGGSIANYVCEQHFDVISRHKACLLLPPVGEYYPGEEPNLLLMQSMKRACRDHMVPRSRPPCVSSEMTECLRGVLAAQCGDEIAGLLRGFVDRVRDAANCPEE